MIFLKLKNNLSFTLVELVAVVVIIGILAGLMVPQVVRARERAMDKQARAILKTIQAAQRAFFSRNGFYYPVVGSTTSVANINSNLLMALVDDGAWAYYVDGGNTFDATMQRDRGGWDRTWRIMTNDVNATCSAGSYP